MKRYGFLFLLFFVFSGYAATAQQVHTAGYTHATSDWGYALSLIRDDDDQLVQVQVVDADVYLLKSDSNGNITWQRKLVLPPNSSWSHMTKLVQTTDSCYVCLLNVNTGGFMRTCFFKVDKQGNFLWAKKVDFMNTNAPTDICAADSGSFICASSGGYSISKYDAAGQLVWRYMHTQPIDKLVKFSDDYFIAVAASAPGVYLLGFDGDGHGLWSRHFDIIQHPNDTIFTLRTATKTAHQELQLALSSYDFNTPVHGSFFLRTDSTGDMTWIEYVQHARSFEINDAIALPDNGNLYAGMMMYTDQRNAEALLAVMDSSGQITTARTTGGQGFNAAYVPLYRGPNSFYYSMDDFNPLTRERLSFNGCRSYDTCSFLVQAWYHERYTDSVYEVYSLVGDTAFGIQLLQDSLHKTSSCQPTGITATEEVFSFSVQPNPSNDRFVLQFSDERKPDAVTVFDAQGRCVKTISPERGQTQVLVDLSGAAPGLYFARVISGAHAACVKLLLTAH